MSRAGRGKLFAGLCAILAAASLWRMGLLDPAQAGHSWANLRIFLGELFPPSGEVLPRLIPAMLETIEIAFTGTLIGFCVSLPLAFLATRGLFASPVTFAVRGLIGMIRTVPSILYGLMFVVVVGLGPAAGVLAVAAYSVGYLAKFFYETFEGVDPEVIEALKGSGAGRLQLFRYALLPESLNAVLSQLIFMFEYNIRASTIMGFVGAGGIGYYMIGYAQMLQYQRLFTALLLTFVVVMAIDFMSLKLRSSFFFAVERK